ncbi:vitamin K epoxide reductase family protein [Neorhodopirellula lusitana]|uniref:vitamin K epoxide reductase family protein n=1 Tax=Neorhodopirellula lusitana TaxID=445327 RepID=UPI00384E9899
MSTVDLHRPMPHSVWGWHGQSSARKTARHPRSQVSTLAWSVMLTCSIVALTTSSYLAWSAMTSSPVAGCSGGSVFDCDHVLHSRWSKVLSVPVSIPAILTHASVIGLLLLRRLRPGLQRLRWVVIGMASLAAGGAAIWFIGLQLFALGHLCPYCLVAHAAGIVLAGTFLWSRVLNRQTLRWIGAASGSALAVMITIQLGTEPPASFETIEYESTPAVLEPNEGGADDAQNSLFAPPASASSQAALTEGLSMLNDASISQLAMALINPATLLHTEVSASETQPSKSIQVLGGIKLGTKDWPLVGAPDAEIVFVEMFDYTCPHCQKTHKSLDAARQQLGDKLAVITLPVPLDGKCNPTVRSTHASHSESCEIAKLAVAVWMVDRQKFAEFHDYLFEFTPTYSEAMSKASSTVDRTELTRVLSGPVPSDYISKHVQLYQKAGAGIIPKLLFSKTTTVGAVESPQAMIQLINQNR